MFELVFYAMLLQSALAASYSAPPVLLWSHSIPLPPAPPLPTIAPNIFKPVSSLRFADTLKPLLQRHMIVAYVAQNLTTKDFLCQLAHPTRSCFGLLQQQQQRSYYSQVQQPLQVLQQLARSAANSSWQQISLNDEAALSPSVKCRVGHLLLFNFSDTLPQRAQNLLAHDRFIAGIDRQLRLCPVVQLYTAEDDARLKVAPAERAHRVARDARIEVSEKLTILRHEYCLFAFSHIMIAKESNENQIVHYDRKKLVLAGDDALQVKPHNEDVEDGFMFTLNSDAGEFTFSVVNASGNWLITNLKGFGESFESNEYRFFNKKNAYCCDNPTFFSEDGSRLTIFKWRLDLVMNDDESAKTEEYQMKPCWHCQYYLSVVTGQVLLVICIMTAILSCGLFMIWDIGRNRRMPNPLEPDPPVSASS